MIFQRFYPEEAAGSSGRVAQLPARGEQHVWTGFEHLTGLFERMTTNIGPIAQLVRAPDS